MVGIIIIFGALTLMITFDEEKESLAEEIITTESFEYRITSEENKSLELRKFNGTSDSVSIPLTVVCENKEYRITSIAESAFEGCTSIRTITIPDTVKELGTSAFKGCTGIVRYTFTPGNGVGFDYDDNTHTPWIKSKIVVGIKFNEGIKTIGKNMFRNFGSPIGAFPESLTAIEDNAFRGCDNLGFIYIPPNMSSLGKSAFEDSMGPIQLDLSGVSSLGDYSLKNLKSLERVVFSDSLRTIGKEALCGCDGIKEIQFGNGMTSVSMDAFKGIKFYEEDGITPLSVSPENLNGFSFKGTKDAMVRQGAVDA